jgi:hypothetical protein
VQQLNQRLAEPRNRPVKEALTRPFAIGLALRAVGGLTTTEIASAFLVPEATTGRAQFVATAPSVIVRWHARRSFLMA